MTIPAPPAPLDRLRENLATVYDRIEAARRRGVTSAPRVDLIAVTKAAPAGAFDWLRTLGERDVGENRVPDAASKKEAAPRGLVWHGIGHLQTNKVKKAVRVFDVFHALDSIHLAEALHPVLEAAGIRWPVYAQVNAARDPAKSGVPPEQALAFAERLASFPTLDVVGWMTMAELPEDPARDPGERARPSFRLLREIRDDAVRRGVGRVPPAGLSMGMSDDYEVAVEEGATIVRVGRALWRGLVPDSAVATTGGPRTVGPPRT
jgi:pyridoxal phosphate enzyme (YggS family)